MQEDYGGYAGRRKKPGIGRYPMGPTNIDRVDIGSCVWYPTFLVDTVSGRRLRVSTRMKMANQVKRSKIANCLKKNYGGYAGRLRRLCTEKEKARERSVPDGSDNYLTIFLCSFAHEDKTERSVSLSGTHPKFPRNRNNRKHGTQQGPEGWCSTENQSAQLVSFQLKIIENVHIWYNLKSICWNQ